MNVEHVISAVVDWAQNQATVKAAALLGSYARGSARPESDIDLIILTTEPEKYRLQRTLIGEIFRDGAFSPISWQDEDYGVVWSRRAWVAKTKLEVELSFGLPTWANVHPLDLGTRAVISNGCRILYDPNKMLSRLCDAVRVATIK